MSLPTVRLRTSELASRAACQSPRYHHHATVTPASPPTAPCAKSGGDAAIGDHIFCQRNMRATHLSHHHCNATALRTPTTFLSSPTPAPALKTTTYLSVSYKSA